MKQYNLDEVEVVLIGKKGTPEREEYEFELQLESIGSMIKTVRKKKNMTQAELGRLVGVKKNTNFAFRKSYWKHDPRYSYTGF